MITIEDGSKEMCELGKGPYVRATIEPGRWPCEWWFEVDSWEYDEHMKMWGWTHHYLRDGGGFGLWRQWKKAHRAVVDLWFDLYQEEA